MVRNFEIDGWIWHGVDADLVAPWFADRERLRRECAVKGSELRDVFRVEMAGKGYFVKYHHPDTLFQQVRSGIAPKAKKEFDTAHRLLAAGIPVAAPVGWGSCGSRSMLLTREVPGAQSARAYWFGLEAAREDVRKRFLAALGAFLGKLLAAHVQHPDFHLGNLLVSADRRRCRLTLVDVYGVTLGDALDEEACFAMLRILGALRGEMRRAEVIEFLRLHALAPTYPAASELWHRILVAEARQMERLWPKRRRQILAGSTKYLATVDILGCPWRIRRGLDSQPLVGVAEAEEMDWRHLRYDVRRLAPDAAEALWLTSFRLAFHRVHHPRAVAWIAGGDDGSDIVLTEHLDDPVVVEGRLREEFLEGLKMAGIRIPEGLGTVVTHVGRPALRDPAMAEFAS